MFCLIPVLVLDACDGEKQKPGPAPDPRMTLIQAAEKTLDAGPALVRVTVRSGPVRYRLDGHLDPAGNYRLCAVIAAGRDYLRGRLLWLEGRAGSYGTLTTENERCVRRALWLDDHPPTLELSDADRLSQSPRAEWGGEDFLHAALVALTGVGTRTVIAAQARACGRSQCYEAEVDFERLDRKPRQRDEDGWTLRPLLRSLGRHPVSLRVAPDGFVDRLAVSAPGPFRHGPTTARVAFELSGFGEGNRVPSVSAQALE
jgi:hypothetical protein